MCVVLATAVGPGLSIPSAHLNLLHCALSLVPSVESLAEADGVPGQSQALESTSHTVLPSQPLAVQKTLLFFFLPVDPGGPTKLDTKSSPIEKLASFAPRTGRTHLPSSAAGKKGTGNIWENIKGV